MEIDRSEWFVGTRTKARGAFDPDDGRQIKDPVPGRWVTPAVGVAAGAGIGGIVIWEGLKWGAAVLGAPETGGASLALLALP